MKNYSKKKFKFFLFVKFNFFKILIYPKQELRLRRMFRDVKNSLKMGHYFDFSRRKLSGGTSNFNKMKEKSTKISKATHLKFWSSNRSESNEILRRPKSNRNGYKTPFSPTRKLQVVSARKVWLSLW